eukprot:2119524-Pyramimonas_sp.AAC.1
MTHFRAVCGDATSHGKTAWGAVKTFHDECTTMGQYCEDNDKKLDEVARFVERLQVDGFIDQVNVIIGHFAEGDFHIARKDVGIAWGGAQSDRQELVETR